MWRFLLGWWTYPKIVIRLPWTYQKLYCKEEPYRTYGYRNSSLNTNRHKDILLFLYKNVHRTVFWIPSIFYSFCIAVFNREKWIEHPSIKVIGCLCVSLTTGPIWLSFIMKRIFSFRSREGIIIGVGNATLPGEINCS